MEEMVKMLMGSDCPGISWLCGGKASAEEQMRQDVEQELVRGFLESQDSFQNAMKADLFKVVMAKKEDLLKVIMADGMEEAMKRTVRVEMK